MLDSSLPRSNFFKFTVLKFSAPIYFKVLT